MPAARCRACLTSAHLQSSEIRLTPAPRDNGVGIPEGLDLRSTPSLGWSLVRMLAEDQLGGTIGINGGAGTEVVVRFALKA